MRDPSESGPAHGEVLRALFAARAQQYSRCLAIPGCEQPAIRAHSVQNARILDSLEVDGHLIALEVNIDAQSGPQLTFERVGRNRATTFTGLCAEHDSALFAPIDTAPPDLESPQHRFLFAYRAALYESHATLAVAQQMQVAHLERVKLGLDPKESPSPSGMFAVGRMLEAWLVFRWRVDIDLALHAREWSVLEHEVLHFDVKTETVAASGLFSIGTRKNLNDLRCVALTVIPLSPTHTAALFSFKPEDAKQTRRALRSVFEAPAHDAKYQLSRTLLQRCQNFVLSPSFFESWTDARRDAVRDFFLRTLADPRIGFDSPDLILLT